MLADMTRWREHFLIWFLVLAGYNLGVAVQAQFVSYPLYKAPGSAEFLSYHAQYNESIPLPVILPGFAFMLLSAAFVALRPAVVSRAVALAVTACGLVGLLTTTAWAIPRHDELDRIGQSLPTIDSLLMANAVRTLAFAVEVALLVWIARRVFVERALVQADSAVRA